MSALFHVRHGRGAPLLLIQGLSGTHRDWGRALLTDLERSFDVVVYDHPGIGRSPGTAGAFSIADLADAAAGLLDELGLVSAHVLGVSMGGMVAQELALARPARVRTLTLGCTTPGGPQAVLGSDPAVARLAAAVRAGLPPALAQAVTALPGPLATIAHQFVAVSGHDTSARLGTLRVATLVVHGDRDLTLPIANGRLLAELIPGARLEVLAGAGHRFWLERPAEVAALLRGHAVG